MIADSSLMIDLLRPHADAAHPCKENRIAARCAVSLLLLAGLSAFPLLTAQAQVRRAAATHKKSTPRAASPQSTVAKQIEELQRAVAAQAAEIATLKSGLAQKDAQAQKAEAAALRAETKAEQAAAAAQTSTQVEQQNASSVATLSSAVSALKGSQVALAAETKAVKTALTAPTELHYKGITLTPGGFFSGDVVYRAHSTGGELPTALSSIPYEHADAYALSETFVSGRQSRLSLLGEGKLGWGTLRGYVEADFLGVGTTSNNNQTNSYLLRQRLALLEAETSHHWIISGGQGWSLSAENRKGISTAASSIALPLQIDPNYVAGLVWNRGGFLRLTKLFPKVALAASIENPQILYTATLAGNTPYAVLGTAGAGAGLLNQAISSCTTSTTIVSYTSQGTGATSSWTPVYKTVSACSNLANISFNQAPDVLVKAAFDPGRGHYEIFGIARFAHETVFPGETTDRQLYGGLYDVTCPKGTTGCSPVAPALSTSGSFNNSIALGGIGASARVPVIVDKFTLGLKGLYGPGVGRYGDSTLPDATTNRWGGLEPIHNLSGIASAELTPTPRLTLYAYYGGDYASRADFQSPTATTLKIGSSPCFLPTGATSCTTAPTSAQLAAGGTWGAHYTAAAAAVGYGSRLLDNSSCLATTAPGYNGGSTGYYAGASCGAQTRSVQEATAGYWLNFYKGDRGRLAQGVQFGYIVRNGWSGLNGIGAKGIEPMFFTSFRYFLP
jgi:FKBP-type peptidyl-prolyl cis-trans isomerase